eukprot:5813511-Amphidinium_carterae.1
MLLLVVPAWFGSLLPVWHPLAFVLFAQVVLTLDDGTQTTCAVINGTYTEVMMHHYYPSTT